MLFKCSTQYLIKWIASFRMAENGIARGKLKNLGGGGWWICDVGGGVRVKME